MVRSALTALAFAVTVLVSPVAARAQQQTVSHVVAPGETLAVLAERFLGDHNRWPEILEANRDRLSSPDQVTAGMELVIPVPPTVRIQRVEQAEQRPPVPGRSRFYGNEVTGRAMQVQGEEVYRRPAVSEDVFYSAEWLVPGEDRPVGMGTLSEFVGMDQARRFQGSTVRPFDRVRIEPTGDAMLPEGRELQVFRVERRVRGLGWVMRPTGSVRVTRTDGGVVVAEVVREFDNMSLGDLVRPAPDFPLVPGVAPRDVQMGSTSATIVEWGELHQLQQYGDVAFLDAGSEDGVAVGDEYVVSASADDAVAGRLQVVGVGEGVSSARIVQQDGPVFDVGTRVYLARKMP